MERVKEIRRANWESLLREFKATQRAIGRKGTLRLFAHFHGLNESHASQIKTGVREIGHELARQIEQTHSPRLPHGWLDTLHHETDPSGALEEAYAKLAITLYRKDPRGAQAIMRAFQHDVQNKLAQKHSKLTHKRARR